MDAKIQDERFSFISSDPRFKPIPHKERKIKIDKRFQTMFKDKSFKLKYTMDKYGRPMQHTSTEDLKKFYELSDSESENEKKRTSQTQKKSNEMKKSFYEVSDSESENEVNVDKKSQTQKNTSKIKKSRKTNEARETVLNDRKVKNKSESNKFKASKVKSKKYKEEPEQHNEAEPNVLKDMNKFLNQEVKSEGLSSNDSSQSDSESSTSIDSDFGDDDDFDHKWGELDADAPHTTEITNRLAVCNMDWDRIQAMDLLILFNSFKPSNGAISCVKIYPSEYGLQRLQEEERHGPAELVEKIEENESEDNHYHVEKLRTYQLNRLKYYYAIVECDSPETANTLYEELDGMEYESSSSCFDLRFIPDDINFEQEPSSVADTLPDISTYKPSMFITSALQQAKVHLTWDETDPRRTEIMHRAFLEAEKAETDVQTYLAASSSSEDEGLSENSEESVPEGKLKDKIAKYKSLLQSIEEEEKKKHEDDVEMEITWEPGLKETAEELVKAKQKIEEKLTPWEEYLEKKKKKKKQKKKEKKLQAVKTQDSDDSEEDSQKDDDILENSDENTHGNKKRNKMPENDEESSLQSAQTAELDLMMIDETTVSKPCEDADSVGVKKKKKKKMKKVDKIKSDNFEVDVKDPRFSAVFTSHIYNIDPSDPHYKDTKGMKAIIQEKQRKIIEEPLHHPNKREKLSTESEQLITSIKNKVQSIQNRKRKALI